MTRNELSEALLRRGVEPRAFDLVGSGKDESYCLEEVGELWSVYYRERGLRRDEERYSSESEACLELLGRVLRDPTTRG